MINNPYLPIYVRSSSIFKSDSGFNTYPLGKSNVYYV